MWTPFLSAREAAVASETAYSGNAQQTFLQLNPLPSFSFSQRQRW